MEEKHQYFVVLTKGNKRENEALFLSDYGHLSLYDEKAFKQRFFDDSSKHAWSIDDYDYFYCFWGFTDCNEAMIFYDSMQKRKYGHLAEEKSKISKETLRSLGI